MDTLFGIVLFIEILVLVVSLVLRAVTLVVPVGAAGYVYYFSMLGLMSSVFVIVLVLLFGVVAQEVHDRRKSGFASKRGKRHARKSKRSGKHEALGFVLGLLFFGAIDVGAFFFLWPLVLDLPAVFNPTTVRITNPEFVNSSDDDGSSYHLNGADQNGGSHSFELSWKQFDAYKAACEVKDDATVRVVFLPHSECLVDMEVE